MKRSELLNLAERLLTKPTAPYHEEAVRGEVMEYCRNLGLRAELDRVGNVIVRYRHRAKGPPLVFVAHMDHPGFESLGGKRAEFLGGVPKDLFKGARARFFTSNGIVRATIRSADDSLMVELDTHGAPRKGDFGMWDLPGFRVANGKLRAPAIDDVLSVVVMLATLGEVVHRKAKAHVWAVFTRAEEVGFHGAAEIARARKIPRNATVISMEMSRERPWAKMGNGPVVRVGDRLTTFDPMATLFLQDVAQRIRRIDPTFRSQRCLMDGGACEATAFAAFGYRVGGLCLPLGNYHNIGPGGKVRAEYVSVNDLENLLRLTVAAAEQWSGLEDVARRQRARMEKIRRSVPRVLKK